MESRKVITGKVVSDKMDKTIVVAVHRRFKHKLYQKFLSKTIKYKAHDEKEESNVGDIVEIVETRPMSKEKRWKMTKVIERAV